MYPIYDPHIQDPYKRVAFILQSKCCHPIIRFYILSICSKPEYAVSCPRFCYEISNQEKACFLDLFVNTARRRDQRRTFHKSS